MLAIVATALLALDVPLQDASTVDTGGRVAGRVVSTYPAGTSSVVVTLQPVDPPGAERRTTTTDASGRFSFDRVPAGRYVATAEKAGYTSKSLNAGEGRFDAGIELTVSRERALPDVEVRLWRAASLAGRVIRSDGAAAPGIHVALARRHGANVVTLHDTQVTTTWDGRYTITGLPPGDYLVMATGVVRTSSTGVLPTASPEQAAFEINVTRPDEFTPTLYPGVPATEPGSMVTLLEGLVTSGIDVWLAPARRFSISGRVTWPADAPVDRITIEYGHPSGRRANIWTVSDPGGLFTIDSVAPGTIVLMAWADSSRGRLMAIASTDVRADSVEDVTLTLEPPARVEGRVVFPSDLPASAQPKTIALVPKLLNVSPLYPIPNAPIASDGTFSVSNLLGQYEFALTQLGEGFHVASVSREGELFVGNRIGIAAGEIVERVVVTVAAR